MEQIDPREKLTLLTAKPAEWSLIPGGFQRLTAMDVAAMLAKASKGASSLARVKYMGRPEYIPKLKIFLGIQWIKDYGVPRETSYFWPMIDLAIREVSESWICRWCHGAGILKLETGKPHVCEACKGEGRARLSDRKRARILNIQKDRFRRSLGRQYMEPLTIVHSWEQELFDVLRH